MKVEFTKEQYNNLIDMIFLGSIMINSAREQEGSMNEYEELEQYVYSLSKAFGIKDKVEYNEEYDSYFPVAEYEERLISKYINEYNDAVFWSELSARLAERDIKNASKLQVLKYKSSKAQEIEEFLQKQFKEEEKYVKEFSKNGLKNLQVKFG